MSAAERADAKRSSASRSARPRRRVGVEPDPLEPGERRASSASSRCVPAPIRASSTEPHSGHASGISTEKPQWWQWSRESPCSVSAMSQLRQRRVVAARAAVDGARDAAPVEEEDRAAAALLDRRELGEERRRERVPGLAPQIDELDRRHGRPIRAGSPSRSRRAQLSARGVALP